MTCPVPNKFATKGSHMNDIFVTTRNKPVGRKLPGAAEGSNLTPVHTKNISAVARRTFSEAR
jgi:hypothetical protein